MPPSYSFASPFLIMYSANAYEGLSATKILINAEADVNAKDNYGNTVLMYNCRDLSRGIYDVLSPNVVKSLIRAGANINEVIKMEIPLYYMQFITYLLNGKW